MGGGPAATREKETTCPAGIDPHRATSAAHGGPKPPRYRLVFAGAAAIRLVRARGATTERCSGPLFVSNAVCANCTSSRERCSKPRARPDKKRGCEEDYLRISPPGSSRCSDISYFSCRARLVPSPFSHPRSRRFLGNPTWRPDTGLRIATRSLNRVSRYRPGGRLFRSTRLGGGVTPP